MPIVPPVGITKMSPDIVKGPWGWGWRKNCPWLRITTLGERDLGSYQDNYREKGFIHKALKGREGA